MSLVVLHRAHPPLGLRKVRLGAGSVEVEHLLEVALLGGEEGRGLRAQALQALLGSSGDLAVDALKHRLLRRYRVDNFVLDAALGALVERFDIEPFSDFSAK